MRKLMEQHFCGMKRVKFEGTTRLRRKVLEFLLTATNVTREPLMDFFFSARKLDRFNGGRVRTGNALLQTLWENLVRQ